MPTGTVTANGFSQSGKPQVTIDGQKYSSSRCVPATAGLQIGDKLEFDSNSDVFKGNTIWFINSYKLVEGAQKYPSATQGVRQNAAASAPRTPTGPVSAGSPVQDAERPAISNWVAAAIQAGALKDPNQIHAWVRCAKQALREDGSIGEDKDLPY